jgi:predicted Zn-dependent protease
MSENQGKAFAEIKKFLVSTESAGLGLGNVMGLSKQEMDATYVTACQQVQAGQAGSSAKLFTMLIALKHDESKYWRGLGLSMQRMKLWPPAEFAYTMALRFNAEDFVSRVFYAEVLLKLNRPSRARNEVDRALADGKRLAKPDTLPFVKRGEKLRAFILSAGDAAGQIER